MKSVYLSILLITHAFLIAPNVHSSITLENLRCEYQTNPTGIDVQTPRLSWQLQANERDQQQSAYHVVVASSLENLAANQGDLWDSEIVSSNQSIHIRYAGKPLCSNQTYYWKVCVWNTHGDSSGFSEPAQFSTALLHFKDWQARWIGRGVPADPENEVGYYSNSEQGKSVDVDGLSALLRKEINLLKKIKKARVFVTGLGFYELYLNGNKVGNNVLTPAKTNYRKQVLYDTYDVTEQLKTGANALGIMLGNGWFNPYKKWWSWRQQWFGSKRAILQLHVEYADGAEQVIVTDDSWKAATGPVIYNCIYDGEVYDANWEKTGWAESGYDDADWEQAQVATPPGGKMISQMMEPIHVTQLIKPVAVTNPTPGVYVYDMGQNFAGWARIKVRSDKSTKVKLQYAENLLPNGRVDVTTNNLAGAKSAYILKGDGIERYEPRFTYYGFRYVEITGEPELPERLSVEGCVVHSACEQTGHFTCSNEAINWIHRCVLWSQRSNMAGYPTDCPQRDERLGWMGDAHVTAEEAMFNFHTPLFYQNWLSGIQSNQQSSGDILYISPRPSGEAGTSAWSSAYILIPWYHYQFYGDKQILQEHFESMCHYVDYLETTATDYILPDDKYGDWVSIAEGWKRGKPASVSTAYFYYNASIVAKAADILGKPAEVQKYQTLAENIKRAWHRTYFNSDTGYYEDGSQCSQVLPLFLNIAPESVRSSVADYLLDNILSANQGHLNTGIIGTKYLMELLTAIDKNDIAYLLATQADYPGWYSMCKDRTTLSERWDQGGSNNHVMFGNISAWFYRTLAGINPDEAQPGFKHFTIKPYVQPDLSFVHGSFTSMYGEIISNWEYRDDECVMHIKVPVNTSATVYVPARNKDDVFENDQPAATAYGVRSIRMDRTHAVFEVGSGEYRFVSRHVSGLSTKPYVVKPEIAPRATYFFKSNDTSVKLASPTDGAEVHYTLDGSEPTPQSALFQEPLRLSKDTIVKAKAFKPGYQPSLTSMQFYTFIYPENNGLTYQVYEGAFKKVPDFEAFAPVESGVAYQVTLAEVNVPKYNFAVRFSGSIDIVREGEYTFFTRSNDGSQLFINNKMVVDNDGEHGFEENSGSIYLKSGPYPIEITYFQSGGSKALEVRYQGPGIEKQIIPASVFYQ